MVRRLQPEPRLRRLGDPVVLPSGFPACVPGPPRWSRLVGVTADAAEDGEVTTVVYSARIESDSPVEAVHTHYLAGLQRAGFVVSPQLAATDRFDADAVLGFHGHGCTGEILVARARGRTDIAVVVRVDRPRDRADG